MVDILGLRPRPRRLLLLRPLPRPVLLLRSSSDRCCAWLLRGRPRRQSTARVARRLLLPLLVLLPPPLRNRLPLHAGQEFVLSAHLLLHHALQVRQFSSLLLAARQLVLLRGLGWQVHLVGIPHVTARALALLAKVVDPAVGQRCHRFGPRR